LPQLNNPPGYRGRHVRPRPRRPLGVRGAIAAGVAVAAGSALLVGGPAGAVDAAPRIDLRVLVVSDGSVGVDAVTAELDREGVPYDQVDLRSTNRTVLTATALSPDQGHGKYQGVVVPNNEALSTVEAAALAAYEKAFGVRRIVAYTWAGEHVGQSPAGSGTIDGTALTVTEAGKAAGFGYLTGAVSVDDRDPGVDESYASMGVARSADFTPLIEGQTRDGKGHGAVAGVLRSDGREELVLTLALNRYQTHGLVLGHGLVNWLTNGVHLGHWRNWFSLHVDDIFLPDNRWHPDSDCTVGDNCPAGVSPIAPDIRMVPADVDVLLAWQRANGIQLDLAYNAGGSADIGASDALAARLLKDKDQFRWLSHTYSHPYLGCVKDTSQPQWRCATDPATGATQWVPKQTIVNEITQNNDWARGKRLPIDDRELVTGQHSGLRSLPQMPQDNPNLAPGLASTKVTFLASDASREASPRTVGPARTVPRHPTNIYYNVATVREEVDEYNWIYTSKANGGSGICESDPSSTCIAPLKPEGFASYIVPTESRIAFDHVVSVDPRPHYAHQSNITEDRVLYPVLDHLLARYRNTYTSGTPLVNLRFSAIGQLMRRQELWRAAVAVPTVTGYRQGTRVTVVNSGTSAIDAPVAAPTGTRVATVSLAGAETLGGDFGDAYGGQRSGWSTLRRAGTLTLRLPS
jgi:hypothetical protein